MNKTDKEELFWNPPVIGDHTVCLDRLVDYPEIGDNVNFTKLKEKEDANNA